MSNDTERADWGSHTQVVTQFMDDLAPAQTLKELGKQVSPTLRELFVVCEPSEALRQHFELGAAPFVLVHDLGGGAARAFLQGIGERVGRPVQALSIRRQGFGTVLASLSYVDCPMATGPLRVYAAEVQAEALERVALRHRLIAAARAHVLIGEVPTPPEVAARVTAWRDDLLAALPGGALNLLALPQLRDPDWMMSLSNLTRTPRWQVEVAPASRVVATNWTLVTSYWNRQAPTMGATPAPATAAPQVERMTLDWAPEAPPAPMVALHIPAPPRPPVPSPMPHTLAAHVAALMTHTGALRACVFAVATREVLAQTEGADGGAMAEHGHALLVAVGRIGQGLALGRSVRETHVSLGEAQVLLRPTRLHSGGVLMLILPRDADVTRVRARILQYEAQALPTRTVP